jgi:tetrapyrrole methylase family protein/MazG family protein
VITVVGLGPAGPEYVSAPALAAVDGCDSVFLRTARHPAAEAVTARRPDAVSFDDAYEKAADFESLYRDICEALLAAAASRSVCYAVPGSPNIAERSVELLRATAAGRGVVLVAEPALSFLDLAYERLRIDPVTAGLRILDAERFEVEAAAPSGPLIVAQAWSRRLLSAVKLSLEDPPPGQKAIILHHLGLPEEQILTVPWAELDRSVEADHLTSVFVPALEAPPAVELSRLAETVGILRRQCPWDRQQTHRSLLRHLLEEAYEALDAIDALGDEAQAASDPAVRHAEEELGDLLCQVFFHAKLASEEGLFTLSAVARSANEKLVERHPHVFGDVVALSADDVVANWERSKDQKKKRRHLLDGVPPAMPALIRAEKFERKLKSVGLGWETTGEPAGELSDRLERLLAWKDVSGLDEASGDLLLQLARLLAARGVDAEVSLRRALSRAGERVAELEEAARQEGMTLDEWVSSLAFHEADKGLC